MVVVAVDASREITEYALEWAARNVIKSSDSVFLLAVLPLRKHPPDTDGNHSRSRTSHLFSSKPLETFCQSYVFCSWFLVKFHYVVLARVAPEMGPSEQKEELLV